MNPLLQTFGRSFDYAGRATRKEFWSFALLVTALLAAALGVEAYLNARPFPVISAHFLVLGLTYPTSIALGVRRLHDVDKSGWWLWLGLVPVVGLALLVFFLAPSRPSARGAFAWHWGHLLAAGAACAVGLFLVLRMVWAPYWIPTESMKPGLLVGDYLIARRISAEDVVRGDVLVFRHPVNGRDYVMRLIGLPGDTVQMRDGVIWLNGVSVPQRADGRFEERFEKQGPLGNVPKCQNAPVGMGGNCIRTRLIETLPEGREVAVLNSETGGYTDDTPVFTVPAGQYFLLGDNRDNSIDSRFGLMVGGVGFLPADHVIGRADRILFSSSGSALWYFWTWRSDRFFRSVL